MGLANNLKDIYEIILRDKIDSQNHNLKVAFRFSKSLSSLPKAIPNGPLMVLTYQRKEDEGKLQALRRWPG